MADLQLQVPQQVKHGFGRALLVRRRLAGGEDHEVEVAERRHLAAAGAAEADDRQGLRRRIALQGAGDEVVGNADDLVVEIRRRPRRRAAPVRIMIEPAGDLGAAAVERRAQQLQRPGVAIASLGQRGQSVGKRAAVDNRAAILDAFELHLPCSAATRLRT